MPIRLRITFLFAAIATLLLVLVGSTVYIISKTNRTNHIKTRLINRAITTARLLQSETFDHEVITKIDLLTASALKNKTVQAYDRADARIYMFSDRYADTIAVSSDVLTQAREKGNTYFFTGRQDAIAFHFTEKGSDIVILSAAHDELGNQNLKQLLVVLIVACAGGVIVAIGSGYFFSRQLLSPLSRIADQVNEISAQNLASRIPTGNTRDEWHYLTDTLNRLLNRLQESFDTQRRFISNASHELSTPLTSVSSQLQVYLQKERTPAEYRQVLESVYQDVQHLSQLTRTLLEFAKTSGDTGGLELNTLRIDELLLRLPSELQKNNPAHSVSLSFNDLPEDEQALFVFGNEELLFTAIRNIVENACKYSTDSRAEVALSAQEGRIEIIVSDNGKGISEAHLNTIFEPFFREADLRSTEGFGLGLALAQKIIKLHKGSIEVKSVVGTGSAFIITLPSTGRKF